MRKKIAILSLVCAVWAVAMADGDPKLTGTVIGTAESVNYSTGVDFDWDNALIMKVNDWLTCNLTARLVYDEDIAPLSPVEGTTFRQFKEVLSLGISYKLP